MGFDTEKSFTMAERLKQLREEKGLSHEKLSKALYEQYGVKISSDSLINYEVADAGHAKAYKNQGMRVEYLRCLADFFGVSADYLLGITGIRSQDADIKMVSEKTGLSEKNASILCNAKRLYEIMHGPQLQENKIKQRLIHDLAENLDFLDMLEACSPTELAAQQVFIWGFYAHKYVNDLLDAYTSAFSFMDNYAALSQFGTSFIDYSKFSEDEFNNAAHIIHAGRMQILSPAEYAQFKSAEIAKAIDFFFREKYGKEIPDGND